MVVWIVAGGPALPASLELDSPTAEEALAAVAVAVVGIEGDARSTSLPLAAEFSSSSSSMTEDELLATAPSLPSRDAPKPELLGSLLDSPFFRIVFSAFFASFSRRLDSFLISFSSFLRRSSSLAKLNRIAYIIIISSKSSSRVRLELPRGGAGVPSSRGSVSCVGGGAR